MGNTPAGKRQLPLVVPSDDPTPGSSQARYWAFRDWTSFVSSSTGKTWFKPLREAELRERQRRAYWARARQMATDQKAA